MKEYIINYLDKHYKFTLSTYVSYKLYDRIDKCDVSIKSAYHDLSDVLSISEEEFLPIFDEWANIKAIEINNKVTDIRYKLHELGITLEIPASEMNSFIDRGEDGLFEMIKDNRVKL